MYQSINIETMNRAIIICMIYADNKVLFLASSGNVNIQTFCQSHLESKLDWKIFS